MFYADRALKIGKAKTRDGRRVYELKEAILDGEAVLIGAVDVDKRKLAPGQVRIIENVYWERRCLGIQAAKRALAEHGLTHRDVQAVGNVHSSG